MQGGTGQRGRAACSEPLGRTRVSGARGEDAQAGLSADALSNSWCRGPTGHSEWAQHSVGAALTIPRGQEVAVGTEGQRANADLRVCSVGSGLQRLQGHRHRGDLI